MPWQSGSPSPAAHIASVLLLLLLSACTTVPVDNDRPSTATRLEIQQKIFEQTKVLFLNQQYTQAANALLILAKEGHIDAQYTIGYMYHYGYGVPRNEKESIRWITIAAARGHPQAEEALARINASHDQHEVLVIPAQP
ncbi:MAG: sel1 repeat family protein [Gammaproteobacteria bacterium]|nr:sel1 repeat family protein [Gammaproteobacteria bacterium]MCF6259364.1 sel1 repeat family protein [Gammaproteobacteria bacterium]